MRRLFGTSALSGWLGISLLGFVFGASGCRGSDAAAESEAAALPLLSSVGPFWLTDQAGRKFTEQHLDGKIWVAAFMFTRCPTICPEMTRRMRLLQEQAAARKIPLHLLSFSVDPGNDTPEVLTAFAKKHQVDLSSWWFLTGDNAVIRAAAENGFKIAVDGTPKEGSQHYGITHGTHLVLLDGKRRIRGYYQSSEPQKLEQLLADAAKLSAEP